MNLFYNTSSIVSFVCGMAIVGIVVFVLNRHPEPTYEELLRTDKATACEFVAAEALIAATNRDALQDRDRYTMRDSLVEVRARLLTYPTQLALAEIAVEMVYSPRFLNIPSYQIRAQVRKLCMLPTPSPLASSAK